MATIYTKSATDKTLILAPREGFLRQFDFGADWTEMRVGVMFNFVTAADDNAPHVTETVPIGNALDRVSFGIKDTGTLTIPGQTGSRFLGIITNVGATLTAGVHTMSPSTTAASIIDSTISTGSTTWEFIDHDASLVSNYVGAFCVKFVISNRDLATQSVEVSMNGVTYTGDPTPANLRTQMNTVTYGGASSFAWNTGGVARPLPDGVWIRFPFYNNRLRISCIRAIRYAPL